MKRELVEVKPDCFCVRPLNVAKFSAAEEWCKEKGLDFVVWTEKTNPELAGTNSNN